MSRILEPKVLNFGKNFLEKSLILNPICAQNFGKISCKTGKCSSFTMPSISEIKVLGLLEKSLKIMKISGNWIGKINLGEGSNFGQGLVLHNQKIEM